MNGILTNEDFQERFKQAGLSESRVEHLLNLLTSPEGGLYKLASGKYGVSANDDVESILSVLKPDDVSPEELAIVRDLLRRAEENAIASLGTSGEAVTGEKRWAGFLPYFPTHVFVPEFLVDSYDKLFKTHGFTIKVLPLGIQKDDNYVPPQVKPSYGYANKLLNNTVSSGGDFSELTKGISKDVIQRSDWHQGGIDLDAGLLNMKIKRDGKGMPLPMTMQDPALMHIEGLSPTILEITPANTMPIFSELKAGGASTTS